MSELVVIGFEGNVIRTSLATDEEDALRKVLERPDAVEGAGNPAIVDIAGC